VRSVIAPIQLIAVRFGRGADRHDARAGQPDRLIHRCAIIDEVAGLDHDFVAQAARIRQTLDQPEVVAGHGGGRVSVIAAEHDAVT
jgi:hypothetical protein